MNVETLCRAREMRHASYKSPVLVAIASALIVMAAGATAAAQSDPS